MCLPGSMYSTLAVGLISRKILKILLTRLAIIRFANFFLSSQHCRKLISCLKQALIYTGENDKIEKLKNAMTVNA